MLLPLEVLTGVLVLTRALPDREILTGVLPDMELPRGAIMIVEDLTAIVPTDIDHLPGVIILIEATTGVIPVLGRSYPG